MKPSNIAQAYAAVESKAWTSAAGHAQAAAEAGESGATALLAFIAYRQQHYTVAIRLLEDLRAQETITPDGVALLIRLHLLAGSPHTGWGLLRESCHHDIFGPSMYPLPHWKGEPLEGKRIIVWGAGLGDEVFFVRYIPKLVETGAEVILSVRRPLVEIFKTLSGQPSVYALDEPIAGADFQLNTAALPALFGAMHSPTAHADVPYLSAAPLTLAEGKADLRVGLVWAADSRHLEAEDRTCALADMAVLGTVPGVRLFNLQVGRHAAQADPPPAGMQITPLSTGMPTFSEQGSQMAGLDLIISVDTVTANLAGALGLPVWVALPHIPDWRWNLQGDTSPWFPSARVFRQVSAGNWRELFGRMAKELAVLAAEPRQSQR